MISLPVFLDPISFYTVTGKKLFHGCQLPIGFAVFYEIWFPVSSTRALFLSITGFS